MGVLVLCGFGVVFLFVGGVLAAAPNFGLNFGGGVTIHTSGRVGGSPGELQSQPTGNVTQLDKVGYLSIVGGVGFFTGAFLLNRKSTGKEA